MAFAKRTGSPRRKKKISRPKICSFCEAGVKYIDFKDVEFRGTLNIDDNIYTLMEVAKKASGKPFNYRIERNKIYVK